MAEGINVYKILVVAFFIWAIGSTAALAYYVDRVNFYESRRVQLEDRLRKLNEIIDELNSTLIDVNGTLQSITREYVELLAKYRELALKSIALLVIDYGNGTIERHIVYFIEGYNDTVFNLTIAVAEITYTYYPSLNDVFIESINGVSNMQVNATSGYYWMLYVNFKLSPTGAYNTRVYNGDIIIWNYTYVSW